MIGSASLSSAQCAIDKAVLIKPTLYDLFDMHAEARGSRVDSPAEADTVFSLQDGITPFDADRIMSEFMTNGSDQSEVQGSVVYVTDT